jgi:hypothetical protein
MRLPIHELRSERRILILSFFVVYIMEKSNMKDVLYTFPDAAVNLLVIINDKSFNRVRMMKIISKQGLFLKKKGK